MSSVPLPEGFYLTPLSFALSRLATSLLRGEKAMPPLDRETAQELGQILLEISFGGDPEKLRWKRKPASAVAIAYWYHYRRILAPQFSDQKAILDVREDCDQPTLKDSTIRKYAQLHRDAVLDALEQGACPPRAWGNVAVEAPDKGRVHQYREYLRLKTERPDVENDAG